MAIATALILARWKPLGRALLPYAIAANAIPIIAFAPIFNNWFGVDSQFSKAMIAAVLVFFALISSLAPWGQRPVGAAECTR